MEKHVVITIARQYGSGGKTIAAMRAKKLGINCYSSQILRDVYKRQHLHRVQPL